MARPLAEARLAPEGLFPDDNRGIKEFKLTLSRVPGLNRDGGKGSFAESVVDLTKEFYGQVLQPLRAWKEAAPKLVSRTPEKIQVQERVVETLPVIAPAVKEAQSEADPDGGDTPGEPDDRSP